MKKVLLIILDGWGYRTEKKYNAIFAAHPKNFCKLWNSYSHTTLNASGEFVGLLKGDIGNSQVGHLHIGAGRLVKQDVTRIFGAINDGSFFQNSVLLRAMSHAKKGRALHLLGLLSDANVHSNIYHLFALIKMAHLQKVHQVYVHAFLDGRDTPPCSAKKYIETTERELRKYNKNWKIASVTGRYYAMDRDNKWNREHKAYEVMVNCKGDHYDSAEEALNAAYARGESDEFVKPSLVAGRLCSVKEGDAVIFFNFRSDRARQLTRAFVQGRFEKFVGKKLTNLYFVCMTQYDPDIKAPVAFAPIFLKNTLGEIISKQKIRQFRIAETEKWAHLTYFLNGLSGRIFNGEDRLLIPSPKVKTYDQKPVMSARRITKSVIKQINAYKYGFIAVNFANPDMVGHTGNFNSTVSAIKSTDYCVGKLVVAAQKKGYDIIITADHGNAEQMRYQNGGICTAHTTNKVPCIIIAQDTIKIKKGKNYALYNIAPTVLELLGIKKPKEMDMPSLLEKR